MIEEGRSQYVLILTPTHALSRILTLIHTKICNLAFRILKINQVSPVSHMTPPTFYAKIVSLATPSSTALVSTMTPVLIDTILPLEFVSDLCDTMMLLLATVLHAKIMLTLYDLPKFVRSLLRLEKRDWTLHQLHI